MTYEETLHYLYSRLPMFSKIGASAIKKDLTNTLELCRHIGDPHRKFKSVHVGGTNGKGSVSHMLAAVLQQAGYKTGLYTSPHLKDFRERIRINGQMIPEEVVVQFVQEQKANFEVIEPSFFEVTVAMAFDYFAQENVDIAVIEVGLGGRLDSTNIITPILSIITNIGYDHTNILGDTLPEIAAEKAGIIKPGIPAIIGERNPETEAVFLSKAREVGSPLLFAADEWYTEIQNTSEQVPLSERAVLSIHAKKAAGENELELDLDLTGSYQLKNVKAVLSAVEALKGEDFEIGTNVLQEALKNVTRLTGLMGRWQSLGTSPKIICDTGHNEHGIREIVKQLSKCSFKYLHLVFGMVKDKDISKVLALLPKEAAYYFCQPNIERAKSAHDLAAEAEFYELKGRVYSSVQNALDAAKQAAAEDDLIFVGGSTFVVAEIL